jgi:shikimate kinase
VLVGIPGAGKTTVAPHAARLLDTTWCDLDQRIIASTGRSISNIISMDGEVAFRALERAAIAQAIGETPQVIATGGGWAAEPGNLAAVSGHALLIYLSVDPGVAALRLAGNRDRPLLVGDSIASQLHATLARREAWYRLADLEVPAGDAPPEAIAAGIATAARQYGGW